MTPYTRTVYYHRAGTGDGASKWLLYYEGGGWCSNTQECYDRLVLWFIGWINRWGDNKTDEQSPPIKPKQGPDRPRLLQALRRGQALRVGHARLGPAEEPHALFVEHCLCEVL